METGLTNRCRITFSCLEGSRIPRSKQNIFPTCGSIVVLIMYGTTRCYLHLLRSQMPDHRSPSSLMKLELFFMVGIPG